MAKDLLYNLLNTKLTSKYPFGVEMARGFCKRTTFQCPILLTGRVGTLGSVFRIKTPCWPSDNTLIVITHNDITYEFLYFQMKLINYKSLNRGSTQPLLTQSDLKNQVLILPSKNILQYFHIIINNIFLYMDNFDNISHTLPLFETHCCQNSFPGTCG